MKGVLDMSRISLLSILAGLAFLLAATGASALDAPHSGALVGCSSCHVAHSALGSGLTNVAGNWNLCMSCHYNGGIAGNLPFSSAMEPGGSLRTSHSWSGVMPDTLNDQGANNAFGLRRDDQVVSSLLQNELGTFGNCSNPAYTTRSSCNSGGGTWTADVVCSTCHSVMFQTYTPWDPQSAPGVAGTASGGSTTTLTDTTQSWTTNQWAGYYLEMTGGANNGKIEVISSNTGNTLTLAKGMTFSYAVAAGDTYGIASTGRHFMRTNNDTNQMCTDCHYYRSAAYLSSVPAACSSATDKEKCNLETWDGNVKSHPVGMNLTTDVTNASLFVGAAPYEPDCKGAGCAETGPPRYDLNGGTDTNLTDNVVLDSNGRIRCLSCHGVHYTDSNSATVDQP